MELHQLRYVLAVAETNSFSRAAQKLFVAQSNVSAQVRKLEQELGVPLFERRAHDVVLTEFGRAFVPGARQTLIALDRARAAVDAVRGLTSGRAALGVPDTLAAWLVPEIVRRFRESYPRVDLWLTEESSVVLTRMVASRELPQALVNLPSPQSDLLTTEPLFTEELVAVVPADHRLWGAGHAPLTAFAEDELLLPEPGNPLRELILKACAAAGLTPNPRVEVGRKLLARVIAVAGIGVGLVPAMTAFHELGQDNPRLVRIDPPRLTRTIALVRHRVAGLSPADEALGEILLGAARDLLADNPLALLLAASAESETEPRHLSPAVLPGSTYKY